MYTEGKMSDLCQREKKVLLRNINADFISDRDKVILTEIGVPASTAPYILFFGEEEFGGYSLRDRICRFEGVSEKDVVAEDAVLDNTCVVGQCGMGYIVINKRGEVWVLDFDSFDEYYANRSLDDFLDCIYVYVRFVAEIHEKYGQGTFVEDVATESDLEQFEASLRAIDKEVLDEDNYWWEEVQGIREYEEL